MDKEASPLEIKARLVYSGMDSYQVKLQIINKGKENLADVNIYVDPSLLLGGLARFFIPYELTPEGYEEVNISSYSSGVHKKLIDREANTEVTIRPSYQERGGNRVEVPEYKFTLGQLWKEYQERRRAPRR